MNVIVIPQSGGNEVRSCPHKGIRVSTPSFHNTARAENCNAARAAQMIVDVPQPDQILECWVDSSCYARTQ